LLYTTEDLVETKVGADVGMADGVLGATDGIVLGATEIDGRKVGTDVGERVGLPGTT